MKFLHPMIRVKDIEKSLDEDCPIDLIEIEDRKSVV